ncbi:MscL family protein [Streptomyces sp. NBC_01803]|uniref:MscL family protein n=1 Tax=Streptomyces sp. NBC_01803 TaxID=2975946 RepID=UPI002DD7F51A|nr:MscL family protein [Streptomyces sp. NBC_01803]WSA44682.1 MscL family protein [Streptomyces sp. NBC_01803]
MSVESKGVVAGARETLAGFREFLTRGNVVELAVAVVVGTAFTNIVNSVVQGMINPVVGAFGTQNLDAYSSCLRGPCKDNPDGEADLGILLHWGSVLSATLTFLITAGVVYFLMILPLTRYMARRRAKDAVEPQPPAKTELDVLAEIRDELIAQRADRADRAGRAGEAATVGAPRSGDAEADGRRLDKERDSG